MVGSASPTIESLRDETWEEWGPALKSILGLPDPLPDFSSPLKLGTLCSGTDAPVVSMRRLLGPENVEHVYSMDWNKHCEDFVCCNMPPAHFYKDVACLLQGTAGAPCSRCSTTTCTGFMKEVDMVIMGFPCTPFSVLNVSRYMDGYDPFEHKAARPVFVLIEALKADTIQPKMVILENVAGMLNTLTGKLAQQYKTPLDFLLHGTSTRKNHRGQRVKFQHGLTFLEKYKCAHFTHDSHYAGLPMIRRRLFIILIRRDLCDGDVSGKLLGLLDKVKKHPLSPSPLSSFVREDIPMKIKKKAKYALRKTQSDWQSGDRRLQEGTQLASPWQRGAQALYHIGIAGVARLSLGTRGGVD